MDHAVGVDVQAPSSPLVIASGPLPVPHLLAQPKPCASIGAPPGSGPRQSAGLAPMGLAEGMAARDQRDDFFVVHRHATERLPDIRRRGDRIMIAAGSFRIYIDQAHLHRRQRLFELSIAAVALVVGEHLRFRPPVDQIRFPVIDPSAGKTQGFEAHGIQRNVSGQDHQVGPRDAPTVLLLNGPQQSPGLVQAGVVGPAVQRIEALLAAVGAAATVVDTIGTGAVPGHPDHQSPVMAEIRRPPVLRSGQYLFDVALQLLEIDVAERLGVVEIITVGIGAGVVRTKRIEVQRLGPPELVRLGHARCRERICRCHGYDGCHHCSQQGDRASGHLIHPRLDCERAAVDAACFN